jgi:hypothetical protein
MYRKPLPTQERLREIFTPETLLNAGCEKGKGEGYYRVTVDGEPYMRHRLMYVLVYGAIPDDRPNIDHINNVKGDDRHDNLQPLTDEESRAKRGLQKNSSTGYKGVTKRRGKYQARLFYRDRHRHLGDFDTPEQAYAAYCEAAKKYWGEKVFRPD